MAAPKKAVGPKSDKLWRDAVLRAVKERRDGKNGIHALDKLAKKIVDLGLEGDIAAIKEIGDRIDGKPMQGMEMGVAPGSNVKFVMHIGSDA